MLSKLVSSLNSEGEPLYLSAESPAIKAFEELIDRLGCTFDTTNFPYGLLAYVLCVAQYKLRIVQKTDRTVCAADTPHTSHGTPHTSHGTPHTSHVTRRAHPHTRRTRRERRERRERAHTAHTARAARASTHGAHGASGASEHTRAARASTPARREQTHASGASKHTCAARACTRGASTPARHERARARRGASTRARREHGAREHTHAPSEQHTRRKHAGAAHARTHRSVLALAQVSTARAKLSFETMPAPKSLADTMIEMVEFLQDTEAAHQLIRAALAPWPRPPPTLTLTPCLEHAASPPPARTTPTPSFSGLPEQLLRPERGAWGCGRGRRRRRQRLSRPHRGHGRSPHPGGGGGGRAGGWLRGGGGRLGARLDPSPSGR